MKLISKNIAIQTACIGFLFSFSSYVMHAQILSGTYVGDGIDNRAITGIGFQPDVVVIRVQEATGAGTGLAVIRTSSMSGDVTKPLVGGTAIAANMIQSLDANGFTLGTDVNVNGSGNNYHWMAFQAVAGELSVGSYTGDGAATHAITINGSFQPDYLYILPENTGAANYNSSLSPASSYRFSNFAGTCVVCVTSLDAAGFTLGDGISSGLNTSAVVYHYVAWKQVAGKMKVGTYAGNGTDNTSITGIGFYPEIVAIIRDNVQTYFRSTSMSGDLTVSCIANVAAFADGVQALETDGFQVGTSATVNTAATTYPYAAWGPSSLLPIELLSFTATPVKQADDNYIVRCNWATATEINNDYFTVERSKDGTIFSQIGTMKGAGNSNATLNYEYDDMAPYNGLSYYRLKQTDYDGKYTYSNIVPVFIGGLEIINFYPNPAIEDVTATIVVKENTTATVEVFNTLGERVLDKEVLLNKGLTLVKLNVSQLAAGNYMFRVILPTKEKSQKVFVR